MKNSAFTIAMESCIAITGSIFNLSGKYKELHYKKRKRKWEKK